MEFAQARPEEAMHAFMNHVVVRCSVPIPLPCRHDIEVRNLLGELPAERRKIWPNAQDATCTNVQIETSMNVAWLCDSKRYLCDHREHNALATNQMTSRLAMYGKLFVALPFDRSGVEGGEDEGDFK